LQTNTCYCILDANMLLHFRCLAGVDWRKELDEDAVVLVVCPPVLRELENHEKASPDRKIRDRAQRAIAKVRSIDSCASQDPLSVGAEVEVLFEEATLDWGAHGLDKDVPDDRIIAHGLELGKAGRRVKIATDDYLLQGKIRNACLDHYAPPDRLRLPMTETDEEKETKRRLKRLQEIESAQPRLQLLFDRPDGATDHIVYRLPARKSQREDYIDEQVAARRGELQYSPPDTIVTGMPTQHMLRAIMDSTRKLQPSEQAVREYESAVETHLAEYRGVLERKLRYEKWHRLTVEFAPTICNEGQSPADDIDVVFRFPGGISLLNPSDAPEQPVEPEPPKGPKSRYEEIGRPTVWPYMGPLIQRDTGPRGLPPELTRRGPTVPGAQPNEVRYWFHRLKQGQRKQLEPTLVTFPEDEAHRGIEVLCKMVTVSAPGATETSLHIVLESGSGAKPA